MKSTNMLEPLNEEIRRRTRVFSILPNLDTCLRPVRALVVEIHEGWLEASRYLKMDLLRQHKKSSSAGSPKAPDHSVTGPSLQNVRDRTRRTLSMRKAAVTAVAQARESRTGSDVRAAASRSRAAPTSLEAAVFWVMLMVIALAPLPLGSNRPLPAALLASASGALVLAWGIGVLVSGSRRPVPVHFVWPALVLFGLGAGWAAVQTLPFTPAAWHHPYWAEARASLDLPVAGAISLDPDATRARLAGLLAYAGIFWLGFQLCRSPGRAEQAAVLLSLAGLFYAGYGLFDHISRPGPVTSTFVNRNSYATYAGMSLFCGLALVVQAIAPQARAGVPLRRALLHTLARLDFPLTLGLLTFVVCSSALLLTQSRGAFLAVGAAFMVYLWSLRTTDAISSRPFYALFGVLLIAAFLGVVHLSGEATLERFEHAEANLANRLVYYRTTWDAIWDRPLLGTGYGTYADAFHAYNHPGTMTYFLDKAHSTYLQIIMELGWPAAGALFLAVAFLVCRCRQGLRGQRRNAAYLATVVACSVLVGVHALVDFSLEIPANAATFALLLGLGCALSTASGDDARSPLKLSSPLIKRHRRA